jgi:hypothetical protein
MEQRLFFNGIHVLGNELPIDQCLKAAVLVFPYLANTTVPGLDNTSMTAEGTSYFLVV